MTTSNDATFNAADEVRYKLSDRIPHTPLPWKVDFEKGYCGEGTVQRPQAKAIKAGSKVICAVFSKWRANDPQADADAALIVHSVNTRPALLAERDELRKERDEARKQRDEATQDAARMKREMLEAQEACAMACDARDRAVEALAAVEGKCR